MKNLFYNKTFRKYLFAYTISSTGSWIRFVITPLYLYKISGSYSAIGIGVIISSVSKLFFAPMLAPIFDNIHKKTFLVYSYLALSILVICYTLFPYVYAIYIINFLISLIRTYIDGASLYVVRKIVPSKNLVSANSILNTVSNALLFIGPICGGFLADTFGYEITFLIDSISYLIFSVVMVFIKISEEFITRRNLSRSINIFSSLKELYQMVEKRPALKIYLCSIISLWIGVNGILIVYPILCNNLTAVTTAYGTLWTIIGAGQMLGGFVIGIVKLKNKSRLKIYFYCLLFTGLFHMFFSVSTSFIIALVLVFIATIGDGISIVIEDSLIQKKVKGDYMIRYNSYTSLLVSTSGLIGSTLATILLKFISYQFVGVISSSIICISGLLGLLNLARLNRKKVEDDEYAVSG